MHYCLNPACADPVNSNESRVCQACNTPLLLKDRYIAIKLLGQGGFGRTFLAIDTHPSTRQPCVIKQLFQPTQLPHHSEKVIDLFQQEAHQLNKLGQNAHIPSLFDHFQQDSRHYLIQEFIDGQDLQQAIKQGKPYSQRKVLQLLRKVLPTLNFIHQNKVIHRDIKPANIICRQQDRELFLVDLGAAKQATDTALVKTGTVIGSAEYTAPEQAKGKAVFASDIYGLGTTCLHLMTHMSPFDLFDSGIYTWVWRDYLLNPVDDDFAQIIDKMIQPATNHRYQSVAELQADLAALSNQGKRSHSQQKSSAQQQNDLKPSKASNPSNQAVAFSQNRVLNTAASTNQYLEPSPVQNPFLNGVVSPKNTDSNLRISTPQALNQSTSARSGVKYQFPKKRRLSQKIGFATVAIVLLIWIPITFYQARNHTDTLTSSTDSNAGQPPNATPDYYQQIDIEHIPGVLNTKFGSPEGQDWVPQVHRIIQTKTGDSIGQVQVAISELSQLLQIIVPKITGEPASVFRLDQLQFDYGTTLSDDFFVLRYAGFNDLALGAVQFWNIESRQLTFQFAGGTAFIRNETKEVGYLDMVDLKIKVYNFETGKYIRELGIVGDASFTTPIAISPNETYLITVSYHNAPGQVPVGQRTHEPPYSKDIQVWNLDTGKLEQEIESSPVDYTTPQIIFSENGRQATVVSTMDGSELAVIQLP